MKHSPQIALTNARVNLEFAREQCPHWDLENNEPDGNHDCCYLLDEATIVFRAARKAVARNA